MYKLTSLFQNIILDVLYLNFEANVFIYVICCMWFINKLIMISFVYIWASQVALVVKNQTASAGDTRDASLIPGLGRSPRVKWQPTHTLIYWKMISWWYLEETVVLYNSGITAIWFLRKILMRLVTELFLWELVMSFLEKKMATHSSILAWLCLYKGYVPGNQTIIIFQICLRTLQ